MSLLRRRERLPERVQIQEIDERHDLSQQIYFRRQAQGWTQQELAERCGLTQPQVATLEAGQTNPTLRTLVKLGAAFGCRVRELFAPAESSADPAALHSAGDGMRTTHRTT